MCLTTEDKIIKRAADEFRAAQTTDFYRLVDQKRDELRHYDALAIDDVLAICAAGRSGSLLLASFLDASSEVIMLPGLRSKMIYPFFEKYESLSAWDKLITYPMFSEEYGEPFFYGDFPISTVKYHAAVVALSLIYGSLSLKILNSRRAFFQFVHVAYSVALERYPSTLKPLIVYAQHAWDNVAAERLVEDFPKARFVHAVREPIVGIDSWFDRALQIDTGAGQYPHPGYLKTALDVVGDMSSWLRPHPKMESRTRAVRFEDLHVNTDSTLRSLATWLGISHDQPLGESTFNGIAYIAERGESDWTGPQPEQLARPLRNISSTDKALLYALLYEEFVALVYYCPGVFRFPIVRWLVLSVLQIIPMKMEWKVALVTFKLQTLPALQRLQGWYALRSILRPLSCQFARMQVMAAELQRRVSPRPRPGGSNVELHSSLQLLDAFSDPLAHRRELATIRQSNAGDGSSHNNFTETIVQTYCSGHSAAYYPNNDVPRLSEPATAAFAPQIERAVALLAPIWRAIRDHVFAGDKIHAVDKPVRLPKAAKIAAGRAWAYVRDDRPYCNISAPAIVLFYGADRRPEQRFEHLSTFSGFLQSQRPLQGRSRDDRRSSSDGIIVDVACWARCRLKFCEIVGGMRSAVAREALDRIAGIYAIEARALHLPPPVREDIRAEARPLVESFFDWAEMEVARLVPESVLAAAFRYALSRRIDLMRFLEHGCLEIDNNCAEEALRGIPLGDRFWVLSGSDAGGVSAAVIYSIVASARLNGRDPRAYLRYILGQFVNEQAVCDDLTPHLPWNWSE